MEKKLKVFTAFSGYDSQLMALDRLQIDYDCVGWSEIDKYAIQAHNALYPQYAERNYGDISKINWVNVPDFDLFTMSSPCQDFSNAGLQRGGEEGSGTRSSLLWECRKAIEIKRPKYILFENVKALVTSKYVNGFNKWQKELEQYGYTNFCQVLNAKDYGVPQNRERIFMVSILNCECPYYFPKPIKLGKRLREVLDDSVDEKYYLSGKAMSYINVRIGIYVPDSYLLGYTRDNKGNIIDRHPINVSNTIHTSSGSGGNTDQFVVEPKIMQHNYRIRKLTERECFRLMGVSEHDIDKIKQAGISRTQQYKMAGNSIVVDVLVAIFNKLLVEKHAENQLSLF